MKRDKGETMPELLVRSNRALKERLSGEDAKFESWDNKSVQLRLDWGTHIARLGRADPTRLTFRVCSHWNYGHIIKHVADHNAGKQLHGRYLHVWRWGYYMYNFVNKDWHRATYDRDEWKRTLRKPKRTYPNTSARHELLQLLVFGTYEWRFTQPTSGLRTQVSRSSTSLVYLTTSFCFLHLLCFL